MTHTHIQDFFQGVGCLKDNVVCHGGRSGGGGWGGEDTIWISEKMIFSGVQTLLALFDFVHVKVNLIGYWKRDNH